jgi:hypothetical protein
VEGHAVGVDAGHPLAGGGQAEVGRAALVDGDDRGAGRREPIGGGGHDDPGGGSAAAVEQGPHRRPPPVEQLLAVDPPSTP